MLRFAVLDSPEFAVQPCVVLLALHRELGRVAPEALHALCVCLLLKR